MDIGKMYQMLIEDDSIFSLTELSRRFGFVTNSRKYRKMCQLLYEKYGKDEILSIVRTRTARIGGLAFAKKYPTRSKEVIQKIRQSNRDTWEKDTGERRNLAKQLMIENCHPVTRQPWVREKAIATRRKRNTWATYSSEGYDSLVEKNKNKTISEKTRGKMSESAKKRGDCRPAGWKLSEDARNRISNTVKCHWEAGVYKPKYQSKCCNDFIAELEDVGYEVEREFNVLGRPYDIRVGKCLIEFNGTYWHLDPRKYNADFYDKSRKVYAREVWERDREKEIAAKNSGFIFVVVWQADWETDSKGVINDIKKVIEQVQSVHTFTWGDDHQ